MSSAAGTTSRSSSIRVRRRLGIGARLVVAVFLIIFSVFPVLWMISASLNPTGTLATQTLIPSNP